MKGVRSGVERRRGVSGLKARDARREPPGKVLKDRRSPRERGRMGTSVNQNAPSPRPRPPPSASASPSRSLCALKNALDRSSCLSSDRAAASRRVDDGDGVGASERGDARDAAGVPYAAPVALGRSSSSSSPPPPPRARAVRLAIAPTDGSGGDRVKKAMLTFVGGPRGPCFHAGEDAPAAVPPLFFFALAAASAAARSRSRASSARIASRIARSLRVVPYERTSGWS